MKTICLILSIFTLFACSDNQNTSNEAKPKQIKTGLTGKNYFVEITFEDGPLKGTHRFAKEKGNYMASIAVGYTTADDAKSPDLQHSSNFNSTGIINEDQSLFVEYIIRPFDGEASIGDHEARMTTDSEGQENCGWIKIRNNGSEYKFKNIRGTYLDCTSTKITNTSDWKDGTVKKRRKVTGQFSDKIKLEITNQDNDIIETLESGISVSFFAQEARKK